MHNATSPIGRVNKRGEIVFDSAGHGATFHWHGITFSGDLEVFCHEHPPVIDSIHVEEWREHFAVEPTYDAAVEALEAAYYGSDAELAREMERGFDRWERDYREEWL